MEIIADWQLPIEAWTLEADMAHGWTKSNMLGVEKEVPRMAGHNKVDGQYAQVEYVFHWVHGHPRPQTRIGVFVVN